MNLQLVKEDSPVLREIAMPWDFTVDGDPNDLIREMTRVMMENNGIGLAGPQVGINKRIFVMGNKDKLFACINPEILEADGNIMDLEGCLSFPNLWLRVRRAENIKVRYFNAVGAEIITEFTGLISRVFQHERDHLDGVCYDTRVAKLSLEMAKNRRKKKSRKSLN
jgi:peptide deformylase